MDRVGQSGGFLGRLLEVLLKAVLPLIGIVLNPHCTKNEVFH